MKMVELIVLFIVIFPIVNFADPDTTKSDTRLVPKAKDTNEPVRVNNGKKNDHNEYQSAEEDDEDCNFWHCVVREFARLLFVEPVKAFFNRDLTANNFPNEKFRWGLGTSLLDFSLYPKASFSYGVKFNGDFLIIPNEYFTVREHIGAHLLPVGGFLSDFERDVFVNNSRIGVEKDIGYSYYNISIPLSTEIMFRPAGANGSLFFLLGAGPEYVHEKFEGIREYSYQPAKESLKLSDNTWIPSLSFGIGKMLDIGGHFASFEIRYSLGMNRYTMKSSFPGDNVLFTHGFTVLQYQVFF